MSHIEISRCTYKEALSVYRQDLKVAAEKLASAKTGHQAAVMEARERLEQARADFRKALGTYQTEVASTIDRSASTLHATLARMYTAYGFAHIKRGRTLVGVTILPQQQREGHTGFVTLACGNSKTVPLPFTVFIYHGKGYEAPAVRFLWQTQILRSDADYAFANFAGRGGKSAAVTRARNIFFENDPLRRNYKPCPACGKKMCRAYKKCKKCAKNS